LSGDIVAISTNTSWTDRGAAGEPGRIYEVQADVRVRPRIFFMGQTGGPPGAGMTLNWTSLPGQIYHVMFKSNLTNADWIDFSGPLTAASTITSWTDLVSTAVPQRYYRVLEAP
jgi:hypothetical protein